MPEPAPVTACDGGPLHHEEAGRGPPLLCVHGTGSSALAWAAALPRLARVGRVIAYDRRGHGRSLRPAPLAPMSLADHADDAARLLDALDARPAVVIGRSYGGCVALELARRHPRHVRALVLLEGAPETLDPESARWLAGLVERTLAAGRRDPAAAAETLMREVLGDEGWQGLPDEVRATMLANGPAIVAEMDDGYLPAIDAAALAGIDVPALVVSASASPAPFRRADERLAQALPRARRALVPGGHMVDPAGPEVLAFLEGLLGRPT